MNPGNSDIAAIVLAGGASSRMRTPKALLHYRGEGFLDRLVRLFSADCAPVIAVVGHEAEIVARGLARPEAPVLVLNPLPERGQLSSLQIGLRAVPAGRRAVFFHPVDIPAISSETIAILRAAWVEAPPATQVVQPRYQGRKGHPVLIAAPLIAELLALAPEASARVVLSAHEAQTLTVDAGDPNILRDTDTPDDYRRLMEGAPPL